ncbi:cuticlin-4 [Neocloeon triangulifer]|uniref:cuticlin-4 n=1 Tax=Neocloeon triangulifer TaxID=2078957 RepID=UPI00286F7BFB|nr:cuticlin-4 [Neocloeon triangulifer]
MISLGNYLLAVLAFSATISSSVSQLPTNAGNGDLWPLERPTGMVAIQSLEVMCGKEHMDVHLKFTGPFDGLVFSKGQYGDPRCVYVAPRGGGSGSADQSRTHFTFRIAYRRCGTKPDLHGQFYENTVVIQYDRDLLEVWDEAKRLRCEWFNDYEKTASKPPMVIADLDVIQLDFRGDNVDCWMEIQHGKGPWAPPVSGIVPLGSTLTLVIAINDHRGEFDMRVKSCSASDGSGGHVIQLSDERGCVLRPKMVSRFLKARTADERASVITYAFFHAFKFPDALSVHIDCKVEICRKGCQEHCFEPALAAQQNGLPLAYHGPPIERREDLHNSAAEEAFQDMPQNSVQPPPKPKHRGQYRFPQGPRQLYHDSNETETAQPVRRVRRFVAKSSAEDVGVSGLYEVISETDLAFAVDNRPENVEVYQGQRQSDEDVVYGICLPVQSFGALFVVLGALAVAASLFAGTLFHRYQKQRETQRVSAWLSLRSFLSLAGLQQHQDQQ